MLVKYRQPTTALADPFTSLFDFIERESRSSPRERQLMRRQLTHAIDETDDSYTIEVTMPGLQKEDVELSLEGGYLSIAVKEESRFKSRFVSSSFSKSFKLGNGLDTDAVEAVMMDGVLRLTVPKVSSDTRRLIEIK
jgi:HSP20 family protein